MKYKTKTKLRNILKYSFEYIPYYKNIFEKINIVPTRMKFPGDFKKIPILKKADILRNYGKSLQPFGNRFKNINKKYYYFRKSSGTTSKPLITFRELQVVNARRTAGSRINKLWGQNRGKPFCYFSNPINSGVCFKSDYEANQKRYIQMQKNIPSSLELTTMPGKKIEEIIDDINIYNPVYLQGDPFYLAYLSDYILSTGYKVRPIKFIITGIESLLKNHRMLISKAFNCKVFNHWNSSEGDTMGIECSSSQKLHLAEDYIYFEFIEIPGCLPNKKLYKVLITTLDTKVMPLIRYEIGDVVSLYSSNKICKCKNQRTVIKSIEGRTSDLIKLPKLGYITITNIDKIFSEFQQILYYRLILKSKDKIDVEIFLRKKYKSVNTKKLKEYIFNLFNHSRKINLKIVSYFHPGKNGKFSIIT